MCSPSLTEESTGPRTQDADIMFDLHKREMDENDPDNDEEVISIAYFLEVRMEPVLTSLGPVLISNSSKPVHSESNHTLERQICP